MIKKEDCDKNPETVKSVLRDRFFKWEKLTNEDMSWFPIFERGSKFDLCSCIHTSVPSDLSCKKYSFEAYP